jgi:hypothetical protein
MIRNPYTVGNPIRNSLDFYGRRDLARDLLDERQRCVCLVGNRRMGKSSLLYFLDNPENRAQLMPKARQSSLVSLRIEVRAVDDIEEAIAATVEGKARYDDRLGRIPFAPRGNACTTLRLLAETAQERGFEVLLLWDEAEILLELDDLHLRRLHDVFNHPALRVILTASRRLYGLNDKTSHWQVSPFLFGFAVRYIPPLTESEARDLICQAQRPEAEQVPARREVQDRIIELTGSHPHLVQLLSDRLFTEDGDLRPVADEDLAIENLLLAPVLQTDYNALSPSERRILHHLAEQCAGDVAGLQAALRLRPNDLRNYLFGLKQLGYICFRDNRYQLANEFLRQWLSSDRPRKTRSKLRDRASREMLDKRLVPIGTGGPPADVYSHYEAGLRELLQQLKPGQDGYDEVLAWEARLIENIVLTRHYGDTEIRRAERAEIVTRLNGVTLTSLGQSFLELCGLNASSEERGGSGKTGWRPPRDAQRGAISLKADLESNIRASYELYRKYEEIRRLSADPKERARCEKEMAAQEDLIRGYLQALASLGGPLPDDMAQLATVLGR